MSSKTVTAWAVATTFAVSLATTIGGSAFASEVTLRVKNGDFQITGELVSFEDAKYTIISRSLGTMTLEATRYDCVGAGCPKESAAVSSPATAQALQQPLENGPTQLSISGSNTIGNQLMPALIEAYAGSTGIKLTKVVGADPLDLEFRLSGRDGREAGAIALHRHGSSTAFADLEKRVAQIGMASRPVKTEEAQKLITAGLGDLRLPGSEHILGLDGLIVLVSPENPIVSLPVDAIAKIFSGQITDWSQIGQPAGAINVYAPAASSGTFDTFDHLVLKPNKLALTANAKRTENHAEQSDWVAHDPLGIGFTGIAYQRNAKAVNIRTQCGLISQPSVFNIKTEEYPLSRRLFLYTFGPPQDPVASGLLSFALSPQAQKIVRQSEFIDQTPERAAFTSQAERMASALFAAPEDFDTALMKTFTDDTKSGERLSVTFRFQTASYTLDNKALADARRLVELLKSDAYGKKSILLAGFADTQGPFGINTTLSQNRAQAVLAALRANGLPKGQPKIVSKGYSELAPVACNTTPDDMQRNRRVEVWVH